MVIYDLVCIQGHSFEGWFNSLDDFEQQQLDSLLACPVCDSLSVSRKLAVPKLAKKSNTAGTANLGTQSPVTQTMGAQASPEAYGKLQNMLKEVHDFVDSNYQDVGTRFTEEAIRMHRGDKEKAAIRGTATVKQVKKLADEGVSAVPLPARPIDKKKMN